MDGWMDGWKNVKRGERGLSEEGGAGRGREGRREGRKWMEGIARFNFAIFTSAFLMNDLLIRLSGVKRDRASSIPVQINTKKGSISYS